MKTFVLPKKFKQSALACGSQLKNTFCLTKGGRAYLSEPFGDLEDLFQYTAYEHAIAAFQDELCIKPTLIAYDLHPEYLSTKYALARPEKKKAGVQHHHAHVAACMVEHGIHEKVIGVAFDGLGYGSDGHLWGAEYMIADLSSFERAAHLRYAPMPGGTAAIREPWRMALAYLYEVYGHKLFDLEMDFVAGLRKERYEPVMEMLEKKISSVPVSSMGRLFDGVSVLIGAAETDDRGGPPSADLERCAARDVLDSYSFEIGRKGLFRVIDWHEALIGIVRDVRAGLSRGVISAKFHNAVVSVVIDLCSMLREERRINKVVLAGGVFQNAYLKGRALDGLRGKGFDAYAHSALPSNDSAVSLGQAVIALARAQGR